MVWHIIYYNSKCPPFATDPPKKPRLDSLISFFPQFLGQKEQIARTNKNKRAQRALGRSPEEKVKGQGEAIYRGPPINQIWVEDF